MRVPIEFVLANSHLTWRDVRYGLENGYIDGQDVVAIAMACISRDENARDIEVELAGLFRYELHRVPQLLEALAAPSPVKDDSKAKWQYLLLAWLYETRNSVEDPLGTVELIYADFDYPSDMAGFVRYMPPLDGYRPQDHTKEENHNRLLRLWHEYLASHRNQQTDEGICS